MRGEIEGVQTDRKINRVRKDLVKVLLKLTNVMYTIILNTHRALSFSNSRNTVFGFRPKRAEDWKDGEIR